MIRKSYALLFTFAGLFQVKTKVIVVYNSLTFKQHIGPYNAVHGLGLILAQGFVNMAHVKYYKAKGFGTPAAQFKGVAQRSLGYHVGAARARRPGVAVGSNKVKGGYGLKAYTAVAGAGIEYKVTFNAIKGGFNKQVLGLAYFKTHPFITLWFKGIIQVFQVVVILVVGNSRAKNNVKITFIVTNGVSSL